MNDAFSARPVAFALAAAVTVILAGTLLFHRFTNSTRPISVLLVLAGLTIFAFIATILVEGIAGGIFTGALAEQRRKRAIERLHEGDGTFDTTPDPDAVLESGDVMIAAGSSDELRLLEALFAPRETVAR